MMPVATAINTKSDPATRHSYPGYLGRRFKKEPGTVFLAIPGGKGLPLARFLRMPGGNEE